jgi:hypothetical protein
MIQRIQAPLLCASEGFGRQEFDDVLDSAKLEFPRVGLVNSRHLLMHSLDVETMPAIHRFALHTPMLVL